MAQHVNRVRRWWQRRRSLQLYLASVSAAWLGYPTFFKVGQRATVNTLNDKSRRMPAIGGKADMPFCTANVCL
jgi:hypothetical protein